MTLEKKDTQKSQICRFCAPSFWIKSKTQDWEEAGWTDATVRHTHTEPATGGGTILQAVSAGGHATTQPACLYVHTPKEMQPRITNVLSHCLWPSCLIEGLWRDSRETWPTMLWGHVHTAWLNHYIWIMYPVYYYYHYTLPRPFSCLIEGL